MKMIKIIKRMIIGLAISVIAGGIALVIADQILKKYGVNLWPIL